MKYVSIFVKCLGIYLHVNISYVWIFNFLLKFSTVNAHFLCYKSKGFHQKDYKVLSALPLLSFPLDRKPHEGRDAFRLAEKALSRQ